MLTPEDIYAAVQRRESAKRNDRRWLGASIIGHECDFFIACKFRAAYAEQFDGRVLRLFKLGNDAEQRFIDDLKAAGCEVLAYQASVSDPKGMGHAGVTLDGVIRMSGYDQPLVLEMKTHSAKSFSDVKSKGVKASKPMHFAQCQYGMGLAELPNALYIAENKDTSELYLEVIPANCQNFNVLQGRSQRIIRNPNAPVKISERADDYRCKFCGMQSLCHGGALPEPRCTTCCHSTPVEGGKWSCDLANDDIPDDVVMAGCPEHVFLPWLVPAKMVDACENSVMYQAPNGAVFANCATSAFPTITEETAPLIMTSHELVQYGNVANITQERFDERLRAMHAKRIADMKAGAA